MATAIRARFSVREVYRITLLALRTTRAARHSRCDRAASERVMLAVTEVNGCEICSYAHTRRALEAGLSHDEVRELLGGVSSGVPDGQLAGIAFAQHYADTRGHPEPASWAELVDRHGAEQALCVLRAIRLIMWGNALGIPLGSLRSRVKGAPDRGSSLTYETGTLLGSALVTPVALVHAVVEDLRGAPIAP